MKKIRVEVVYECEVPDEANWITVDADGTTCWFLDEPEKEEEFGFWDTPAGSGYTDLGQPRVFGWENSLRKI